MQHILLKCETYIVAVLKNLINKSRFFIGELSSFQLVQKYSNRQLILKILSFDNYHYPLGAPQLKSIRETNVSEYLWENVLLESVPNANANATKYNWKSDELYSMFNAERKSEKAFKHIYL